jgi:CRISPR-associated protein Csm4
LGTPLRSDTLAGHLVCAAAELAGNSAAAGMVERFRQGDPPFVVSSASPHGTLPFPVLPPVRRRDFRDLADRLFDGNLVAALTEYKTFKKRKYIPLQVLQEVTPLTAAGLFERWVQGPREQWKDSPAGKPAQEPHNSIDRRTGTVLKEGGLYFTQAFFHDKDALLDLYVDTQEPEVFENLLEHVGTLGFGKDRSTGKGYFTFIRDADFNPELLQGQGNATMSLSLASATDLSSVKGWYRLFAKHGRAWNGFGEPNPFKRPFLAFEEGSIFFEMPKEGYVLDEVHPNQNIVQVVYPLTIPVNIGGLEA